MIPSGSLSVMSFEVMTGAIVSGDFFAKCVFAPESALAGVFLLG